MHEKKIVMIGQFPPPIHGCSVINEYVMNTLIGNGYSIYKIPLNTVTALKDLKRVTIKKFFKLFETIFLITKIIVSNKIDAFYFTLTPTGGGFRRDSIIVFWLKVFNKKLIFHLHGKGIIEASKATINKELYRYVFSNSCVIHLSKGLLEREIIALDAKGCIGAVVNNGVADISTDKEKDYSSTVFLFFSNLFESKGVYTLIDAFAEVKKVKPDSVLILLGDPVSNDNLKRITFAILKTGNGNSIILDRASDIIKKIKYFEMATVFVHPTHNDAFPLVILEAMSFRLPIIATSQGAIPEIVRDGIDGYIIEPKNTQALTLFMLKLASDTKLKENLGRSARQRYDNNFSISKFKENILSVIRDMLRQK